MSFLTELFLAWRYFKPKRSAVSVITLLSVIGVALGVCVLIVVIAVMTGFTDHLKGSDKNQRAPGWRHTLFYRR